MKINLKNWRYFPKVLNRNERYLFAVSTLLVLTSLVLGIIFGVRTLTNIGPRSGGVFKEGLVGQPRFINPVLASSDVDRDLVQLAFAGLMKYNEKGQIVPDLTEEIKILENGEYYEVTLKDANWSDGQPITSADVIFTINTIQDPSFKSPERGGWMGVKAEALASNKVRFRLEKAYYPFLEKLTVKIIPKHIFEEVNAEELPFSPHNLEDVIGSGPYIPQEVERNEEGLILSLLLRPNPERTSYLDSVLLTFFEDTESLYRSFLKNKMDAILLSDVGQDMDRQGTKIYSAHSPRYFAVFFNPQQEFLSQEARVALSSIINRDCVIEAVGEDVEATYSPILPSIYGYEVEKEIKSGNAQEALEELLAEELEHSSFTSRLEKGDKSNEVQMLQECLARNPDIYPEGDTTGYFGAKTEEAVIRFQEKYYEEILEPWEFEEGTGIVSKTTRAKLNEVCNENEDGLVLDLVTLDQEFLTKTAQSLKEQWDQPGLTINIKSYPIEELRRKAINERDYDLLLFGEMLGAIPDPFPFWHSSGRTPPGLNLSVYRNDEADTYLERARRAETQEEFESNLIKFQDEWQKDQPALMLYSPQMNYLVSNRVKGVNLDLMIDPNQRFWNIDDWYIREKRSIK